MMMSDINIDVLVVTSLRATILIKLMTEVRAFASANFQFLENTMASCCDCNSITIEARGHSEKELMATNNKTTRCE